MGPVRGRRTQGTNAGEFFIPDLCAAQSVFVAVMLSELLVVVHVLASSPLTAFDWDLLAAGSLIVQWVVLLSVALLCYLRPPLSRLSLPLASLCSLSVVALVAVLSTYLGQRLFPHLSVNTDQWTFLRNALVATLLAGIVLRYFHLQQRLRRQEQLELRARLDSLRDRMRPHFLFNTLNGIASLIASQPDTAERAVEDLSELLRVSLQERSDSTTVANELRLCELYLDIERLRLGERLRTEFDVDDDCLARQMPALVLQPLVENAVYHGVSRLADGGTISVAVHLRGDRIRATVENPLPSGGDQSPGHRLALATIRQRLDALYGNAGELETMREDGMFRVCLSYPPGDIE